MTKDENYAFLEASNWPVPLSTPRLRHSATQTAAHCREPANCPRTAPLIKKIVADAVRAVRATGHKGDISCQSVEGRGWNITRLFLPALVQDGMIVSLIG